MDRPVLAEVTFKTLESDRLAGSANYKTQRGVRDMIQEGAYVFATSFLFYLMIYTILALSMNIEYGYTGVPNLG
jgi:Branched-chain amino acid transport system / permease component.